MNGSDQPELPARPQYGEYATPEVQRAHIRQPDVTRAIETGQAVTPPATKPSVVKPAAAPQALRPAPPVSGLGLASSASDPLAVRRRNLDRVLTYVLLGWGLFTVVTRIPTFIDHTGFAQSIFSILGVNLTLSDPVGAKSWGIAAALVLGVGWVLTALLSWLRLRSGRRAWWIPVIGGIVVNLVAGYLLTVPLMNDPAVWPALEKALLGGA